MTPAPDGERAALLDKNSENQCNLFGSGRFNSTRRRQFGLLGIPKTEMAFLSAEEPVAKCEGDVCALSKVSWDVW